jgi:hypothetical protein
VFHTTRLWFFFFVLIVILIVIGVVKSIFQEGDWSFLLRGIVFVPFFIWLFCLYRTKIELYDTYAVFVSNSENGLKIQKSKIFYDDIQSVVAVWKIGWVSENSIRIRLKNNWQDICIWWIKKFEELLNELKCKWVKVVESDKSQLNNFWHLW